MSSVLEWYKDRSVLISGGTGFMGKILVEKLLWSCDSIKNIFLLIRSKKGLTPEQRVESMLKLPIYDRIRNKKPEVFCKIVAIDGDVVLPNLGVSLEQKNILANEVSVVFHLAASLRLEANLKSAVIHNTFGTRNILEFSKGIKNLQVFVHLSTAFCHCDVEELDEKMYPSPADPHKVIDLINWVDEDILDSITPKLIEPHPNCYTYSKRLSETLADEYNKFFPVCIIRPSIVTPVFRDPIPGWVDTLNGPIGLLVGAGKGVIRSLLCNPDYHAEMVPVDVAINGMIGISCLTAIEKNSQTSVYNFTQGSFIRITWGDILNRGKVIGYEYPFEWAVWYPKGDIRTNRLVHNLVVLFCHILPAYFFDFILLLIGQKRFMVRLQNRISTGLEVLQYFTLREWKFKNHKAMKIYEGTTNDENEIFYTFTVDYDIDKYMKDCILGARQYCMKEPLDSIPRMRKHQAMLYVIDKLSTALFYIFILWLAFCYFGCLKGILDYSTSYLENVPLFNNFFSYKIK